MLHRVYLLTSEMSIKFIICACYVFTEKGGKRNKDSDNICIYYNVISEKEAR
jgi:hypothetical protein